MSANKMDVIEGQLLYELRKKIPDERLCDHLLRQIEKERIMIIDSTSNASTPSSQKTRELIGLTGMFQMIRFLIQQLFKENTKKVYPSEDTTKMDDTDQPENSLKLELPFINETDKIPITPITPITPIKHITPITPIKPITPKSSNKILKKSELQKSIPKKIKLFSSKELNLINWAIIVHGFYGLNTGFKSDFPRKIDTVHFESESQDSQEISMSQESAISRDSADDDTLCLSIETFEEDKESLLGKISIILKERTNLVNDDELPLSLRENITPCIVNKVLLGNPGCCVLSDDEMDLQFTTYLTSVLQSKPLIKRDFIESLRNKYEEIYETKKDVYKDTNSKFRIPPASIEKMFLFYRRNKGFDLSNYANKYFQTEQNLKDGVISSLTNMNVSFITLPDFVSNYLNKNQTHPFIQKILSGNQIQTGSMVTYVFVPKLSIQNKSITLEYRVGYNVLGCPFFIIYCALLNGIDPSILFEIKGYTLHYNVEESLRPFLLIARTYVETPNLLNPIQSNIVERTLLGFFTYKQLLGYIREGQVDKFTTFDFTCGVYTAQHDFLIDMELKCGNNDILRDVLARELQCRMITTKSYGGGKKTKKTRKRRRRYKSTSLRYKKRLCIRRTKKSSKYHSTNKVR